MERDHSLAVYLSRCSQFQPEHDWTKPGAHNSIQVSHMVVGHKHLSCQLPLPGVYSSRTWIGIGTFRISSTSSIWNVGIPSSVITLYQIHISWKGFIMAIIPNHQRIFFNKFSSVGNFYQEEMPLTKVVLILLIKNNCNCRNSVSVVNKDTKDASTKVPCLGNRGQSWCQSIIGLPPNPAKQGSPGPVFHSS